MLVKDSGKYGRGKASISYSSKPGSKYKRTKKETTPYFVRPLDMVQSWSGYRIVVQTLFEWNRMSGSNRELV
ncbi:MAG: hypothetical protein Q8859_14090 [Bacteroidota bacterium]|nr:hypothetical protein [Bacteroidota bacterium]